MGKGETPRRSPLEQAIAREADLLDLILVAAIKRTGSRHDAEDLSQQALVKAIAKSREKGEPVPPELGKCLQFVGSFLNSLAANRWRSERRHPRVDKDPVEVKDAPKTLPPDKLLQREHRMRREQRMEDELRARLAVDAKDAVPIAILDWVAKDVEGTAELATAIGCSEDAVARGRRRLGRMGAAVRDDILAEEGRAT
jgi:DNA-directed RNA polymerase specialized sigma24 family protein